MGTTSSSSSCSSPTPFPNMSYFSSLTSHPRASNELSTHLVGVLYKHNHPSFLPSSPSLYCPTEFYYKSVNVPRRVCVIVNFSACWESPVKWTFRVSSQKTVSCCSLSLLHKDRLHGFERTGWYIKILRFIRNANMSKDEGDLGPNIIILSSGQAICDWWQRVDGPKCWDWKEF